MDNHEDQADESLELAKSIHPLLAGHDRRVQGAAIADVLALYLAGHHPSMHDEILKDVVYCARSLIEPNIDMLKENGVYPDEWKAQ